MCRCCRQKPTYLILSILAKIAKVAQVERTVSEFTSDMTDDELLSSVTEIESAPQTSEGIMHLNYY